MDKTEAKLQENRFHDNKASRRRVTIASSALSSGISSPPGNRSGKRLSLHDKVQQRLSLTGKALHQKEDELRETKVSAMVLVLSTLVALVLGYQAGILRATFAAASTASSNNSPVAAAAIVMKQRSLTPVTVIFLLTIFVMREIWMSIPLWLRKQLPFVGDEKTRRICAKIDLNTAHECMGCIAGIRHKLAALYDLAKGRLGQNIVPNWDLAILVMLRLSKDRRPQRCRDRDQRYAESGRLLDIEEHETVLGGLEEILTVTWFSYGNPNAFYLPEATKDVCAGGDPSDESRAECLKDRLAELDYYLVRHDQTALPGHVANFIAINEEKKLCVVSVKGTSSIEDIITDVCAAVVEHELDAPFLEDEHHPNGNEHITSIRCHEGMFVAAKRLAGDLEPLINGYILPNQYKLVITGHSLGGGVATIAGVLLRSMIPALRCVDEDGEMILKVVAFGPPPVLDLKSALASSLFCTSVVNRTDAVPRASLRAMANTAKLLNQVGGKLLEHEINPSLTDWNSNMKFFNMLKAKHSNDCDESEHPLYSLCTPEEISNGLKMLVANQELDDPHHLFVAGKVIHIYDLWTKEGGDESTVTRVHIGDGTSNVLQYIEIDPSLINDHKQYRETIRSLLSQGTTRIDDGPTGRTETTLLSKKDK